MIQTSTQNDLVRYLYAETTAEENRIIESELICNSELLDLYNDLTGVKLSLDKILKKPRERAVENILQYSKLTNLHTVR